MRASLRPKLLTDFPKTLIIRLRVASPTGTLITERNSHMTTTSIQHLFSHIDGYSSLLF